MSSVEEFKDLLEQYETYTKQAIQQVVSGDKESYFTKDYTRIKDIENQIDAILKTPVRG
jgi:hypothetical protein